MPATTANVGLRHGANASLQCRCHTRAAATACRQRAPIRGPWRVAAVHAGYTLTTSVSCMWRREGPNLFRSSAPRHVTQAYTLHLHRKALPRCTFAAAAEAPCATVHARSRKRRTRRGGVLILTNCLRPSSALRISFRVRIVTCPSDIVLSGGQCYQLLCQKTGATRPLRLCGPRLHHTTRTRPHAAGPCHDSGGGVLAAWREERGVACAVRLIGLS
jgi:hypothetical protein